MAAGDSGSNFTLSMPGRSGEATPECRAALCITLYISSWVALIAVLSENPLNSCLARCPPRAGPLNDRLPEASSRANASSWNLTTISPVTAPGVATTWSIGRFWIATRGVKACAKASPPTAIGRFWIVARGVKACAKASPPTAKAKSRAAIVRAEHGFNVRIKGPLVKNHQFQRQRSRNGILTHRTPEWVQIAA